MCVCIVVCFELFIVCLVCDLFVFVLLSALCFGCCVGVVVVVCVCYLLCCPVLCCFVVV